MSNYVFFCLFLLKPTSRLEKEDSPQPTCEIFAYSALFALIHVTLNQKLGFGVRAIISLIPYFIMGVQFGLIRVRLGFLHAVLQHILLNSYVVILSIFLTQVFIPLWEGNWGWNILGVLVILWLLAPFCQFMGIGVGRVWQDIKGSR
jgi:Type II CAAX prenyl endopeptidase Rce1-like